MNIVYIYHSCYVIENEKYILIFDFYKIPWLKDKTFKMDEFLNKEKTILVFASHGHGDHYSNEILKWDDGNRDIYYILSDDIDVSNNNKNYNIVKEGDSLKVAEVNIKIFGSSDLGVSFLINLDGTRIFHAGDLNWWKWNEESLVDQEYAENLFKRIINDIKISTDKNKEKIDIAFFPVDPRLEENKFIGPLYFIDTFTPKYFFPMHFWDKPNITHELSKIIDTSLTKSIVISKNIENLTWR
ncbi:MBL fold metallo-hydrolase [Fusobacterium sp. PH5-44]|uniref:MBL fold metallo-hydrolase n=1 Tax=unclassified Fusobacterium TaxID=2648384 RepID=UPI003D223CB7